MCSKRGASTDRPWRKKERRKASGALAFEETEERKRAQVCACLSCERSEKVWKSAIECAKCSVYSLTCDRRRKVRPVILNCNSSNLLPTYTERLRLRIPPFSLSFSLPVNAHLPLPRPFWPRPPLCRAARVARRRGRKVGIEREREREAFFPFPPPHLSPLPPNGVSPRRRRRSIERERGGRRRALSPFPFSATLLHSTSTTIRSLPRSKRRRSSPSLSLRRN